MSKNEHKSLLERKEAEIQRIKSSFEMRRKQLDKQMEVELERVRRNYEQREASLLRSQEGSKKVNEETLH